MKVHCHCCGREIYGTQGSCSFPNGVPFKDPEFHCGPCTLRLQVKHGGQPCHKVQKRGICA
jgi:hypothetical protein